MNTHMLKHLPAIHPKQYTAKPWYDTHECECKFSINLTLKYQLIAHYFNTLYKTHVKIYRSNPLKFIPLLHVSILKYHHQGVNIPIYEVIEYFLFLLILLVWWRHAVIRTGNGQTSQTQHNLHIYMHATTTPIISTKIRNIQ